MNCGINEFWNGAVRVRLVLKNRVRLGAKQLSVQGQATVWGGWGGWGGRVFKNLHCRTGPWLTDFKMFK